MEWTGADLAHRQARELFETDDDALEYMDDFGLDVARADYLEELGRFAEAAEIHLQEGNMQKGIQMLIRDGTDTSVCKAYERLLQSFWKMFSIAVKPAPEDEALRNLIEMSRAPGLAKAPIKDSLRHEVSLRMYRITQALQPSFEFQAIYVPRIGPLGRHGA